jgi:hypothetical protein
VCVCVCVRVRVCVCACVRVCVRCLCVVRRSDFALQLWDISLARAKRRAFSCLIGELGPRRAFHIGDLIVCLQQSRLTRKAYDDIFDNPI